MGLKKVLFVFVGLVCMGYSTQLQANSISVSADVPLKQTFRNTTLKTDGKPSGYVLQVKLPMLVGVGLEQYDSKLKLSTTHIISDLYTIFYQLPIPILNITFGAGYGKTKYDCPTCIGDTTFKDAKTSTQFVQIGWSILPLLDIHYGLHNTYGSVEAKDLGNGVVTKMNIGGTVSTVGLSIGF